MIKHNNPYTLKHNELLSSTEISFAAKGLFLYLSSLPSSSKFSINGIANTFIEHDKNVIEIFNELMVNGMIANLSESMHPSDVFNVIRTECDIIVIQACKE
ncbi:hypothetical protein [Francisella sp. TX07-6608]|uniref:hypothetical protein n=1 Tax=Francisella sp. TX07-6608 TaxID=573568 RepID=UPI0008F9CD69|nr:hypothetical protein [Francisella sp. TX07-6608]OIN82956.1 hypothetical protein KX00_2035 [Francisella sp. TX07-6608]OIN85090.1 hypothetical protein KX00_2190 [Francisella sp. TX07-6608]